MEKVTGHPRLYRRGAVYWHRAAVPVDIADSYPKTEETFSLRTKEYREALKLVRVAAARVDQLFEAHRRRKALEAQPPLESLTDEQIRHIGEIYYAYRLEEDDEVRNEAFEGRSFEEWVEDTDFFDAVTRYDYARGEVDAFFEGEVDEVLSWSDIDLRLAKTSPSRRKLARAPGRRHPRLQGHEGPQRRRAHRNAAPAAPDRSGCRRQVGGGHISHAIRCLWRAPAVAFGRGVDGREGPHLVGSQNGP